MSRAQRAARAARTPSPFRINLEQQRKQAKDLLGSLRAGDAAAEARFRAHHPRAFAWREAIPHKLHTLNEAQLVVARELGLPSWPRLKAHVTALDLSWETIVAGGAAPDADCSTLHIRCGTDIGAGLRDAGFEGSFLEYSDPLCHGPIIEGPDWLDRRAAFLAEVYGPWIRQDREAILDKLAEAERRLRAAAAHYERIVLWFEHDNFDQLILARCLAQLAETPPDRLELVSPGHYPGATRFIGLGQLPPEALRLLWRVRIPVSDAILNEGHAAWTRLSAPDPRPLAELARIGTPSIPQLGQAIARHCQELPHTGTGLSLSERRILDLLAEGSRTVSEVFGLLMTEREPLPWHTDLMVLSMTEALRRGRQPLVATAGDVTETHWAKERLSLTATGGAVLSGEVDWLSLQPPPRWVGGISIPGAAPCWRWDESAARPVFI